MSAQMLMDHVARLNLAVQQLEVGIESGATPPPNLGDVKSAIDDVRLRLWGLLKATNPRDVQAFQERFIIKRTRELVDRIDLTLRDGQMRGHVEELGALHVVTKRLTDRIVEVRAGR